jgi:molecular chaperone DnaJ
MKDPYAVLGVPKNATKDDIVRAYRKGALKHHPDKNPGDSEADVRFREIQESYDILINDNKRAEYDSVGPSMHFRRRGFEGGSFNGSFGDVMNDFFQHSTFRGRNLTIRLEIDLQEVYTGCDKDLIVKMKNTCTTCKGQGQVSNEACGNCNGEGFTKVNNAPFEFRTNCSVCNGLGKINPILCVDCNGTGLLSGYKEKNIKIQIPCGIESGMNLKISGQGEESLRGGKSGDLIVHVLVREHECFDRDGIDLSIDVPVSYSQLVLGCDLLVPTITDEMITVKIPEGTQSHAKFKLRGRGLQLPNGILGDMYVSVKLEVPKKISNEYMQSIKKIEEYEKTTIGERREKWIKIINKKRK